MKSLLYKELKLSSLAVTYFFIAFGLMTFLPGYPILLGSFFVCMGIFYSFQFSRESNDPLFTVLLPVAKTDAVRAKFLFVLVVQGLSFLLMTICTLVRMILLSRTAVYEQNPLSNANLFYLGFCLVMFGLFNLIFVRGYYETAYKIGVPFIVYCAAAMLLVGVDEALVHIPGFEAFSVTDFSFMGAQIVGLLAGFAIFAAMTAAAYALSVKSFEKLDF